MMATDGWKELFIPFLEEKVRELSSINGVKPEDLLGRQYAKEFILSLIEETIGISLEVDSLNEEEKSIFARATD